MQKNFFNNWNKLLIFCLLFFPLTLTAQCDPEADAKIQHWVEALETDSAIAAYNKALGACQQQENWSSYTDISLDLSEYLISRYRFEESLQYHEQTYNKIKLIFEPSDERLVPVYLVFGEVLNRLSRPNDAIQYHRKAWAILQHQMDSTALGKYYYNWGETYTQLSNIDSALWSYEKVMKIDAQDTTGKKAIISHHLALLCQQDGQYEQSLTHLENMLRMASPEQLANPAFLVTNHITAGKILRKMSRYAEAIDNYRYAQSVLNDYPGKFLNYEGVLYGSMGLAFEFALKLDSAKHYYKQALEVTEEFYGPEHPEIASQLSNIAEVFGQENDYRAQILLQKLSLRIKTKALGAEHYQVTTSLHNLGVAYRNMGKCDSAFYFLSQAKTIRKKLWGAKNARLAATYLEIGRAHEKQLDYARAIAYTDSALLANSLYTDMPPSFDLAQILSIKQFLSASRTKASLLRKIAVENPSKTAWQEARIYSLGVRKLGQYARMQLAQKEDKLTLSRSFELLAEIAIVADYRLFELTGDSSLLEEAYQVCQESKSFLMTEAFAYRKVLKSANIPDSLLNCQKTIYRKRAVYQKELRKQDPGSNEFKRIEQALFHLREEERDFLSAFNRQFPAAYQLQHALPPMPTVELMASLDADEVLVEYFVGPREFHVFWFTSKKKGWKRGPHSDSIALFVQGFRAAVSPVQAPNFQSYKDNYSNLMKHGTTLYNILFPEALKQQLKPGQTITIVPDDWLHALPFEALPEKNLASDEVDFSLVPFMVRNYNISYRHSVRDFTIKPELEDLQIKPYLGFAPNYLEGQQKRSEFGALAGNEDEVVAGAAIFSGKALTGSEASKSAFLDEQAHYRILHLAMHSIARNDDSFRSKLVFSSVEQDSDVYLSDLLGQRSIADLVILSACHSGDGALVPGEGVISMARAFKFGGSSSIVASLWGVHDQLAQSIITDYLQQLHEGETRSSALTKAKRTYLSGADHLTGHPYFWANFVLIGEAGVLETEPKHSRLWLILIGVLLVLFGTWFVRRKMKFRNVEA